MIVYLSGNFPQLSKIEKERKFKEELEKNDVEYHRLVTFFYPKDCNVVLQLKTEERILNESSKSGDSGSTHKG